MPLSQGNARSPAAGGEQTAGASSTRAGKPV